MIKNKKEKVKSDQKNILPIAFLMAFIVGIVLFYAMVRIEKETLHHMLITETFPLIVIILLVPIIIIPVQHYLKILTLILLAIVPYKSLRLMKEDTKMSHSIK